MYDWLENLKSGDTVIVLSNRGQDRRHATVERVTVTQVILQGTQVRFRRKDGQSIGRGRFDNWSIYEPTECQMGGLQETAERDRRTMLMLDIQRQDLRKLTTEQLAQIVASMHGLTTLEKED